MAKATQQDIDELYEDLLDCIDVDGVIDTKEFKRLLAISLEAEYMIGHEDGCLDTRNEDILKLRTP